MFDWITGFMDSTGYFGVALLMFLENVFPPIPSELVMPLAGYHAAQGEQNVWLVILAGSIGSLAGATFWYFVGLWIHEDRIKKWAARHGRWITLHPREVDKVDDWFDRHNRPAVFFGRLVPTIRTLISVPAGLFEMKLGKFLVYSAAGTFLWTALLTWAGYSLGERYEDVSNYMEPATNAIVVLIVGTYLWRVITWSADEPEDEDEEAQAS